MCLHAHKHTHAHTVLLQFLNFHQEWFIYTSIGCSSLWKLLTDPKEFCVFFVFFFLSSPVYLGAEKNVSVIYHFAKISKC